MDLIMAMSTCRPDRFIQTTKLVDGQLSLSLYKSNFTIHLEHK